MAATIPILIVGGVVLLIVLIIVLALRAAKKRTEAWQKAAEDLGLTYFGRSNLVMQRFAHLHVFQLGSSPRITEGITGDTGETEITVADYEYTTHSTDSENKTTSSTTTYTLCFVNSATLNLPHCRLELKIALLNFFRKLFGGKEICITEDPEFVKDFVLRGEDEEAVRKLFTPEVRAWFIDRRKQWSNFEGCANGFVFYASRGVKPELAKEMLKDGVELMTLLRAKE